MADYQTMYKVLFNEVSKAIEILQKVQCETENIFLNTEEHAIKYLEVIDKKDEDNHDG